MYLLNSNEKRQYYREKKAKYRNRNKTLFSAQSTEPTVSLSIPNNLSQTTPQSSAVPAITPSTPAPRSRGRPPLNNNAMTPNTLKKRKCKLMRESRKPMRLIKQRAKAAVKRWKLKEKKYK